jgi:hypothetical protein
MQRQFDVFCSNENCAKKLAWTDFKIFLEPSVSHSPNSAKTVFEQRNYQHVCINILLQLLFDIKSFSLIYKIKVYRLINVQVCRNTTLFSS